MATETGNISEQARGLTDRLRQDGRQQIEARKRTAADSIDQVAQALSRAGEQLDQNQPTLAAYANQIAGSIGTLAGRIRDGSVEDLMNDARQIARRNPGLFMMGSFAVGVALARFMKASQRNTMSAGGSTDDYSTSGDFTATSTDDVARSPDDFSSDFASASADQSAYPSQAYSPSVSTTDQPQTGSTYNPNRGG